MGPIDLGVASFYLDAIRQQGDCPTVEVASPTGLLDRWKHGTHESRIVNGVLHDEESSLNGLPPDLRGSWPAPTSDVGLQPGCIDRIRPCHGHVLGGVDNAANTEAFPDCLVGPSTLSQLLAGLSQHHG
jgi:hypothetical protein